MVCKTEPTYLSPKPLDRSFIASVLRSATSSTDTEIEGFKRSGYDQGYKAGREYGDARAKRATDDLKHLSESVAKFEARSGIHIDSWTAERVGDAVKCLMNGGAESAKRDLMSVRNQARQILTGLDDALKQMGSLRRVPSAEGNAGETK